jgi:hypothetical protein
VASLQNVILDICQRAGYQVSEIDVSLLSGTVDGFVLSNRSSARSMIEELQKAFLFEGIESNGKIKFVPLNQSSSVTVSVDELVATGQGDNPKFLEIGYSDDNDLPKTISINYVAKTADYQQGTQEAIRQIADTGEAETITIAVVMDNDTARQLAEKILYLRWTRRITYNFALPVKYLRIEPADVISITDGSFTHVIRILKKQLSGQTILFEGESADSATYTQPITGGDITVPGGVVFDPGNTTPQYLDIPLLREVDDNSGFYIGVGRSVASWRGAQIYRSADNVSYNILTAMSVPTIMGVALTALPTGPHWYMDRVNAVDVQLTYADQLLSTTEANLLNSVNSAILGNEVIQFQTATLIGVRTYRLSGLYRGRLGTDWAKGSHAINERFVMLIPGGNFERILDPTSLLNASRYYKPVSIGQDISIVTAGTFTNTGVGLKPYSPAHFKAVKQTNGDFILSWIRRTRYNGSWLSFSDVPLNEEREEYTLNIYNGPTIVRTTIVSSPTFTYTAAMQITDFGSVQSTITSQVAQNSATIGPGYYAAI